MWIERINCNEIKENKEDSIQQTESMSGLDEEPHIYHKGYHLPESEESKEYHNVHNSLNTCDYGHTLTDTWMQS